MRSSPWRGSRFFSGRYPESGLAFRLVFAFIDGVLWAAIPVLRSIFAWTRGRKVQCAESSGRVLLVATAHIGDVIIATSALRDLRLLQPKARIGVCVGSWASVVLEGHPGIEWLHVIDHPRMNRRERSWWERLRVFLRTAFAELPKIRAVGYDAVYNLQERHSLIPLFPLLGISERIGFEVGGFGPLLTDRVRWPGPGCHRAEQHRLVLTRGDRTTASKLPAPAVWLPLGSADVTLPMRLPSRYLLIHPGTGDSSRRWLDANWVEFARQAALNRWPLVLCGLGDADHTTALALRSAGVVFVDLVNRLDFAQLAKVISDAACVVCLESSSSHLAAASDRPIVTIVSGVPPRGSFTPLGKLVEVVTYPTPCTPCHKACDGVECVRNVQPETVTSHLLALRDRIDTASLQRGQNGTETAT